MSHLGITQAIHFVERYGYALLFFWVLAEQGALPIPSVPLLVAVGALVRTGRLNAAIAIACCIAGALAAASACCDSCAAFRLSPIPACARRRTPSSSTV